MEYERSLIYTRTGDKGYTSLVGGKRIKKTHLRLEAYGTIDELNACVGWLASIINEDEDKAFLIRIQHHLFSLGSYLATEHEKMFDPYVSEEIVRLENEIDKIDSEMPSLNSFILPGSCQTNALAHVCRTVCRRAERHIVGLEEIETVCPMILEYVNRLSDYFFLLARKQSFLHSADEIGWEKSCK